LADGPTESLQCLQKPRETSLAFRIVRGTHEHADAPHPLALLRARSQRPHSSHAAEQCDELAPPHVISFRGGR
jgi:hypothetical protein